MKFPELGAWVCTAITLLTASLQAAEPAGGDLIFKDDFNSKLGDGWTFEREERAMWRVGSAGLEVRVQPGNMWGGANNAKNVLVHPIPAPTDAPIEISATISNHPTAQWEQANLVWYYDGGNMVKLGQELVTGRYSIVMGREENDRARTVAIIPLDANSVELRLQAVNNRVRGQFRTAPWSNWRDVGECDLPVKGEPKASLHFYNGPSNEDHWVRVNNFAVRRLPGASVDWPRVRVAESLFRVADPGVDSSLATLNLPGSFVLYNKVEAAPEAKFEQRVFVHQDGSYGWFWDRRASASKAPITCGVAMGYYTGRFSQSDTSWLGFRPNALSLESDVVTRLEGDQGNHSLAVVIQLAAPQRVVLRPGNRVVIWFDWYGKASEVQTLNDGYRDYGFTPTVGEPYQYCIKGFRGSPPTVNLQAFLDDVAKRDQKFQVNEVLGVWFGNEVWNGSRGSTLVTKLDLVVDGKRFSSVPAKAAK